MSALLLLQQWGLQVEELEGGRAAFPVGWELDAPPLPALMQGCCSSREWSVPEDRPQELSMPYPTGAQTGPASLQDVLSIAARSVFKALCDTGTASQPLPVSMWAICVPP